MKEDDQILKQLKKTQAHLIVWDILLTSHRHRQAFLEALAGIEVPTKTSPDDLITFLISNITDPVITFTDEDLLPEGPSHNKDLYIYNCRVQRTASTILPGRYWFCLK